MKRAILKKLYIVLALTAVASLVLASVAGSTLAYLTATESVENVITFEQIPLGNNRRDTVNYYYLSKTGAATQISDSGYTNNTWNYRANEAIYADSENTNIKNPPNGFRISYIEVDGTRVNAGGSVRQPNNNARINVYFEPITYTISYDFNGYDEGEINFSETPLQSTYTVYDMINVPYEAEQIEPWTDNILGYLYCIFANPGSIHCEDVPSLEVDGNTLLGWTDQSGAVHTYENATGSWSSRINNIARGEVYSTFADRTTGDLALTARWQIERARPEQQSLQQSILRQSAPIIQDEVVTESDTEEKTETSGIVTPMQVEDVDTKEKNDEGATTE